MCGIVGLLTSDLQLDRAASLQPMMEALRHRGPDDSGCAYPEKYTEQVALGSTRLAIIDPSPAGHQPMSDPERNLYCVFNGEIYNFQSLKSEIGEDIGPWHSKSDTEVVLKAYARWGIEFVEHLRGMFSIAIWDGRKKELILVRDYYGIKPLYYALTPKCFVFASEIRAIMKSGFIQSRLSHTGLSSYLQWGSVNSPFTIVEGVHSLSPGTYLVVSFDDSVLATKEQPYSNFESEVVRSIHIEDRKQAAFTLREILEESVRLHLISDVPLGIFLSGGVDSSALVALMSQVSKDKPRTFTIVFDEHEFSERTYANVIARRFSTEHNEILLSENELFQMLPNALEAMDQPTMDGINSYVISKAVRGAGIKVAISGLGGDELFAGYPSFRRARMLAGISRIPGIFRLTAAGLASVALPESVTSRKLAQLIAHAESPWQIYSASRELFSQSEVEMLTGVSSGHTSNPDQDKSIDRLNQISMYEIEGYLANTLLRDTDQMSMSQSLEIRVPFIDPVVMNFVLALPGKWKMDGARPKPLLLDALGDVLPEEVWRRRKMGFTLPFARWMRSTLRSQIQTVFYESNLTSIGITSVARKIWNHFLEYPSRERWSRSWALYVLARWCEINQVTV